MVNATHEKLSLKLEKSFRKVLNEYLVGNLPVNVFLVDKDGHVHWVNQRLLDSIQATLEEVKGVHISQFGKTSWEHVQEVISQKKEITCQEVHEGHYFSTIRKPIFDDEGEIIGVLGVAVEITEQKKAELAKEQFLHNIRHDIRTPLSGIIGLTDVLKDAINQPELLKLLDSLAETSDSLLTLLDRVFDSIQLTNGETNVLYHRFSLRNTLESVYKLHLAKAIEKSIELNFCYDSRLPSIVIGEELRVQRITWELLSNALKYTEKGSITLNAWLISEEGNKILVAFEVKDTGIGIPFDKQVEVFERFTRLKPSWSCVAPGQGLGLFNIKQMLRDLKGEVFLKSEVHQGSTFTCHVTFERVDPFK